MDLGLYKGFRIREGHRLLFRAEAYDATNTPRFAFPAASVLGQTFGRITGTYSPFNYVGASRSDSPVWGNPSGLPPRFRAAGLKA